MIVSNTEFGDKSAVNWVTMIANDGVSCPRGGCILFRHVAGCCRRGGAPLDVRRLGVSVWGITGFIPIGRTAPRK